jgi:hypothetical protein
MAFFDWQFFKIPAKSRPDSALGPGPAPMLLDKEELIAALKSKPRILGLNKYATF